MHTCPVIVTRYHGPTNARGARIIATTTGKRIVRHYRHELSATGNHEQTATELASQLWPDATVIGGGSLPGRNSGSAFFVQFSQ